jgi:hypothetical protein
MKISILFLIFYIFIERSDAYSRTYYPILYEQNGGAWEIINYNAYEYIRDCLGAEGLEKVVNENNSDLYMKLYYNLDGGLNSFQLTRFNYEYFTNAYFTEKEWETIFDYIHTLPPLPLPNCYTYIFLGPDEFYTKNEIIDLSHQSLIDFTGMSIGITWRLDSGCKKMGLPTDSVKSFNLLEGQQYQYKPFYRTEHPDSLFGLMRWEEVKRRYHDALESGEFKEKPRIRDQIYDGDYDAKGYMWKKIPVKNFSVNVQVPVDSKTALAADTLSASVVFPDSTYLDIRYTKGMPWTELYDGEDNPRKRHVYKNIVTEKYILSSGEFVRDGKTTYWERIRYRYGLTVTLYTSKKSNLEKYYSPIIATITAVLRPKFKTIYLKDDGY